MSTRGRRQGPRAWTFQSAYTNVHYLRRPRVDIFEAHAWTSLSSRVEGLAGRNPGRADCSHETCGRESGRFCRVFPTNLYYFLFKLGLCYFFFLLGGGEHEAGAFVHSWKFRLG